MNIHRIMIEDENQEQWEIDFRMVIPLYLVSLGGYPIQAYVDDNRADNKAREIFDTPWWCEQNKLLAVLYHLTPDNASICELPGILVEDALLTLPRKKIEKENYDSRRDHKGSR